jgi:hypothetical protein
MKPVSVLLIGLGRVGSRFYEKFRELGESRVRLVGVCEIDERHPLLQRAREEGVRVYENFEEALAPSENPVDIILDTTNIPDVKTRSAIGLKKPETAIRCFFRWSLPIFSGIWPLPGKTCRRIMCNPVTELPDRKPLFPSKEHRQDLPQEERDDCRLPGTVQTRFCTRTGLSWPDSGLTPLLMTLYF